MSAMKAAPRSSRVVTNRIEESASASTTWRFSSPGSPNTYSTPSFSRQATRSCATLRFGPDVIRGSLPLPGAGPSGSVRPDGGSTGPTGRSPTRGAARRLVAAVARRCGGARARLDPRGAQHPGPQRHRAADVDVRGGRHRDLRRGDRDGGARRGRSGLAPRAGGTRGRAAIALGGGFAAVAVAKFGMGPTALYQGNGSDVIQNPGGLTSGDMVVLIAVVVGALYVAAIWLLAVVFRPAEPPTDRAARPSCS